MELVFTVACVFPQYHSGSELFSTGIAWKRDAFKMVGFYMVSDGYSCSFLSTHFANLGLGAMWTTWSKVLAFLHH